MESDIGIRYYCCFKCRNFICLHNDIFSRTFQMGHERRAYLFSHAKNVVIGQQVERSLITGMHTVADVFCKECGELLGFTYYQAQDDRNKYKIGKIVIEKFKVDMESW